MRLNAPKIIVWIISLFLAVLAIIAANFVVIPFVTVNAFWFLGVACVLLFLGSFLKGF